jgi:hypothetical protein
LDRAAGARSSGANGTEATEYTRWFERLPAELDFEVWIGDPAVMSRHDRKILSAFSTCRFPLLLAIRAGTGVAHNLLTRRVAPGLTDGSSGQEFRGQKPVAERHLRMMQTLEKHLHTGFAYLLFMDADG